MNPGATLLRALRAGSCRETRSAAYSRESRKLALKIARVSYVYPSAHDFRQTRAPIKSTRFRAYRGDVEETRRRMIVECRRFYQA